MNKLIFKLSGNNHILIPTDSISKTAQVLTFKLLQDMQFEYIENFEFMSENEKYFNSNKIANFFILCFLNGDGAAFRLLVGNEHKGLLTKEELKNLKRDYKIAVAKVENEEFKAFLLLDLLPSSNRRADAIIITNNYEIELYDFSEGKIVDRINNLNDNELSESELKQKRRKNNQQKRIESYKGKINNTAAPINNIILDKTSLNVKYINMNTKFYNFNDVYKIFKNKDYKTLYIPNSLCFLMMKKDVKWPFLAFPLKHNIDSPLFLTEEKPLIDNEILEDIYEKNVYIGFSFFYAYIFITEFTYFKIHLSKRPQKNMEKNHLNIITNNKKKYIYLEDTRTKKWIPVGMGIINKHLFMNVSLKSIFFYLAKMCNFEESDEFAEKIIKYDKLENSGYDFFILDELLI